MGCSPCEQKRREREAQALAAKNSGEAGLVVNMNLPKCGYHISQLTKWKEVLDCGYTKNLLDSVEITEETYGKYIGILNYTIDHIDETCQYVNELQIILNATHVIVALGC